MPTKRKTKPAAQRVYVPPSDAAVRLNTLRFSDRPAWLAEVRDALRKGGSVSVAAELLGGVHKRVVQRWIEAEGTALTKGIKLAGRGRPCKTDNH